MSSSGNSRRAADVGDRHRHLLAYALLSVGVGYAASAAGHLLGGTVRSTLEWINLGGLVVAAALMVPIFTWKLRNRSGTLRHLYFSPDGFVAETVRKAQKASWEATFVLVILLAPLGDNVFGDLPPDFYLAVIVTVMTGVFSIAFLALNRVEGGSDTDETEGVSGA